MATFYTMYKRHPVGDYHVGVCTNTLCAVMGGDAIFARLKDHLDVGNDETTGSDGDQDSRLEHIECNAACDYAPVMMVNWEFLDNQTPEPAVQLVDDLRAGEDVAPPAARDLHLARGRAGARRLPRRPGRRGPGGRSGRLVGLKIARERGWTAPDGARAAEVEAGRQQAGGRGRRRHVSRRVRDPRRDRAAPTSPRQRRSDGRE